MIYPLESGNHTTPTRLETRRRFDDLFLLVMAVLCANCGDPLTPILATRSVGQGPTATMSAALELGCASDDDCDSPKQCVHARCLACASSVVQCGGDLALVRCTQSGDWDELQTCDTACEDGACKTVPSCNRAQTCAGAISCCKADFVQGGDFSMRYERASPAAEGAAASNAPTLDVPRYVPSFMLDRFEVTAGRFLQFLSGFGPDRRPLPGAGAYRDTARSGWDAGWSEDYAKLPYGEAGLSQMLTQNAQPPGSDTDGNLPVRGVNWFSAFAFCIWDGGRLPTEAEWAFAARGGGELPYPWSESDADEEISADRAVYATDDSGPLPVGSKAKGHGKYGEADLAGNVAEWMSDTYYDNLEQAECESGDARGCVVLSDLMDRVVRGGSYASREHGLKNSTRSFGFAVDGYATIGFRCAR